MMTVRHLDIVVVLCLLLLAIVTRAFGLADWSFEADEYFTVSRAHERYTSFVNPAIYALVVAMFKAFGVSEWTTRFPSFVLGTLSIPVLYLTWKNVIGRNVALVAALLIVFSSWHLWHSQFARYYTGVFLFGSLSYYFYYQAIRYGNGRYLAWAILASVIAMLFHITAAAVPAACALFSLFVLLRNRRADTEYSCPISRLHLLILCIAGIAALPLLWKVAAGWHSSGQSWGYGPAGFILQTTKYIQIPIAIAALMGLLLLLQRDFMKGMFFAIGAGVPLLVFIAASSIVSIRPDYMFYIMPLVFILAAFLCDEVRKALSGFRYASHAVFLLIMATLMPEMVSHYTGKRSLDFREVVAVVESSYQPGDKVLSFVNGFDYYSKLGIVSEPYIGDEKDKRIDWNMELEKYRNDEQRLWIIMPVSRKSIAKDLRLWLFDNASMMWSKFSKRYDYTVEGYQIYLEGHH